MRAELLWNVRLLIERLADASVRRRRRAKLRGTVAAGLAYGHLESLELLEIAKPLGIAEIYDIGANVGAWSLLAKAIYPEAVIQAFEPIAIHGEEFERNVAGIEGVHLHGIALGRDNVARPIRVANHSDSSSFLPIADAGRNHFGLREVAQTLATVRRLDEYRAEQRLRLPDLIKLDVQGYELQVLAGGSATLPHVKAIIVEASFVELYEGQCNFAEICRVLHSHGFEARAFGASTPAAAPLVQADVLFLRMNGNALVAREECGGSAEVRQTVE